MSADDGASDGPGPPRPTPAQPVPASPINAPQYAPRKLTQKEVLEQLSMAPLPKPHGIPRLPGVNFQTQRVGFPNIGPSEQWRRRAGRMVNVMWNPKTQKEFEPYLREAQEWLKDACVQLALASGGVCGPIEANALATAAWQTAYARFWMQKASEDPSNGNLFMTASKVADAARQNSLAAYDIAARLSKNRMEMAGQDPLAAFLDVTQPNPFLVTSPGAPPDTKTKPAKETPDAFDDEKP